MQAIALCRRTGAPAQHMFAAFASFSTLDTGTVLSVTNVHMSNAPLLTNENVAIILGEISGFASLRHVCRAPHRPWMPAICTRSEIFTMVCAGAVLGGQSPDSVAKSKLASVSIYWRARPAAALVESASCLR